MTAKELAREPAPPPRPSRLWWGYLALIAVMAALNLADLVGQESIGSLSAVLLGAALLSHDAVCIAGLYAYIRAIPLFVPAVWRVVLTLLIARMLLVISFLAPNLVPWEGSGEQYIALGGLAGLVFWTPMLVVLWQLAFRSAHLWNRAPAG